jgi:hypothetical protein
MMTSVGGAVGDGEGAGADGAGAGADGAGAGAGGVTAVHFAYSVTFDAPITKDDPCAYDVPEPFAAVFQPAKVNPDFASDPLFPSTVTDAPLA